jgi:hypothetical protein
MSVGVEQRRGKKRGWAGRWRNGDVEKVRDMGVAGGWRREWVATMVTMGEWSGVCNGGRCTVAELPRTLKREMACHVPKFLRRSGLRRRRRSPQTWGRSTRGGVPLFRSRGGGSSSLTPTSSRPVTSHVVAPSPAPARLASATSSSSPATSISWLLSRSPVQDRRRSSLWTGGWTWLSTRSGKEMTLG